MRFTFLLSLVAGTQAIVTQPFVAKSTVPATTFRVSHIDADFTASSGMNEDAMPSLIDHLNEENFVESLEMMEPLFMNECVGKEYETFMSQLESKCNEIGKDIPPGYAPHHP